MEKTRILFTPFNVKGITIKNRLTGAPILPFYANQYGTARQIMLDYYSEMASSGVAMIVVENIVAAQPGIGSPFMLMADDDRYIPDLSALAKSIKGKNAIAFVLINHAGRYDYTPEIYPAEIMTGEAILHQMTKEDIERNIDGYASAAKRIMKAGFDGVELHGGTGYLLAQFLSSLTNLRTDEYGGPFENRMRFPLRAVDAVIEAVGRDFPVGYRFLDELFPDETLVFARELEKRGVAYLSVTAGIHDSCFLPECKKTDRKEGYISHVSMAIKEVITTNTVIASNSIQNSECTAKVINKTVADLVGIARIMFTDPLWPNKAKEDLNK